MKKALLLLAWEYSNQGNIDRPSLIITEKLRFCDDYTQKCTLLFLFAASLTGMETVSKYHVENR